MTFGGARARVTVRARDPRLRDLIIKRLTAAGDLEIVADDENSAAIIEAPDTKPGLTRREMAVLSALADGLANKQIATLLGISPHTVKFHLEGIFRKLGAVNRAEAVREGIRRGFITI